MRVTKATHTGEFGRKFGPDHFATQEEYLERIGLINEEFSLDWQIEGACGMGKSLRIIFAASFHRLSAFLEGNPSVHDWSWFCVSSYTFW